MVTDQCEAERVQQIKPMVKTETLQNDNAATKENIGQTILKPNWSMNPHQNNKAATKQDMGQEMSKPKTDMKPLEPSLSRSLSSAQRDKAEELQCVD